MVYDSTNENPSIARSGVVVDRDSAYSFAVTTAPHLEDYVGTHGTHGSSRAGGLLTPQWRRPRIPWMSQLGIRRAGYLSRTGTYNLQRTGICRRHPVCQDGSWGRDYTSLERVNKSPTSLGLGSQELLVNQCTWLLTRKRMILSVIVSELNTEIWLTNHRLVLPLV